MQNVSKEYTKSMKAPLRERGYLRATLNIIDDRLQNSSTIYANERGLFTAPISDVFKFKPEHNEYATFEENFIKVDGKSTKFMKKDIKTAVDTGWVSEEIKTTAFTTSIGVNMGTRDIKGLTLDFGDNYPTRFSIKTNKGDEIIVNNNHSPKWFTLDVLKGVSSFTIDITGMRYSHNRVRLYNIWFGYNFVFNNENIIRSTLNEFASPITSELPQSDFNIVVDNSEKLFDVENPKSPIQYITEKTPLIVQYGYQIPKGNIEWLEPFKFYCNEWDSDDKTFSLTCTDIFRNLNGIYDGGIASENCLYATGDILRKAGIGIANYELDSVLQDYEIYGAFPKVTYREALQLIANYTGCTLRQRRDGVIEVSKYEEAKLKFFYDSDDTTSLAECDMSNLFTTKPAIEYAMFSQDYITVDGGMKFAKTGAKAMVNSGYISPNVSSDINDMSMSSFRLQPIPKKKFNHIRFIFAQKAIPKKIRIAYYSWSTNKWVKDKEYIVTVTDESPMVDFNLVEYKEQPTVFTMIQVSFEDTLLSKSRVILKKIEMDDATSFRMTRTDMISKPRATKGERIGKIRVVQHHRNLAKEPSSIFKQIIDKTDYEPMVLTFDEPHTEYKVTIDGVLNAHIRNITTSPYKITIENNETFKGELEVTAKGFEISESDVVKVVNPDCNKELVWNNPLVETKKSADLIGDDLSKYYKDYISYEYSTRGNPELEVGDIITQDDKNVQIYEHTIEFNQGFKGKIKTYKVGG